MFTMTDKVQFTRAGAGKRRIPRKPKKAVVKAAAPKARVLSTAPRRSAAKTAAKAKADKKKAEKKS